ncbi:uncharacterized protein HMPREF1541_03209 [Cyphellophora europaea CBS 101466]|uniref:Uncharacterized protein n=1 Tax=Cyphellophora europaea (strain CBS 101466) TaxID=1220924 RepID=W2RZZ7_CYPE1|nr:uncharacterized protein HMPREF1541_03209 [Cyphellophora europaea CBS 101466]ETN41274.1 hypothetical protein HMPREF1541_03209 [Cyphellophora europaea CBS 101466]
MAAKGPMGRARPARHSESVRSLKKTAIHVMSPLASPPMVASPIDDTRTEDFSASMEYLITMPRRIDEPLVSFLLRSIFKFPLIFSSVQSAVTSLSRNPEMEGFMETYGEDDGQALIFVGFLYAMGQDIQIQHALEAPDRLPHDLTFCETIGVLHLAELFDLDSLRNASRLKLRELLRKPISPSDFGWAFGTGSRITGPLTLEPEVPMKIAMVDHFTHLWDKATAPHGERQYLNLGKENIEFYLLVKSFCLGNVNEEGINDM